MTMNGAAAGAYRDVAHSHFPPDDRSSLYSPRAASAGGDGFSSTASLSTLKSNLMTIEQNEQTRLMNDSIRRVQEQSYYLKYVIDSAAENGDYNFTTMFASVMEYACNMLDELSTSALTPKCYYELYMKVVDEMQTLEDYFISLFEDGVMSMRYLYEVVQYAPKAVPRLYLQIAVGSALVQSKEGTAKEVWQDLIGAVKCVQCPIRGLFLRTYLSQMSKDKLPGVDDDVSGKIKDAYSFLLENFVEMTKLWVRIQHSGGGGKEQRKRREKERIELRILVGTNLVRLSQLEEIDASIYSESILPTVLEQVLLCKDTLAQGYLMDCVIHVFPDEFQIFTIDKLLNTIPKLKEKVNVHNILQSIMNRLAEYENNSESSVLPSDVFNLFDGCINKIFEDKIRLPVKEIVRIEIAFILFSQKCYPNCLSNVDHCLGVVTSVLAKKKFGVLDSSAVTQICNLLSIPLSSLALKVLELSNFSELMLMLPMENQRQIAATFLRYVCETVECLSDVAQVEQTFNIINPLLKDTEAAVLGQDEEYSSSASFQHEQLLLSRLVHLLGNEDTDELFKIYSVAKKRFGQGDSKRLQHTVVPLVFATISLIYRVREVEFALAVNDDEVKLSGVENGVDTKPTTNVDVEKSDGKPDDHTEITSGVENGVDTNPTSNVDAEKSDGKSDDHPEITKEEEGGQEEKEEQKKDEATNSSTLLPMKADQGFNKVVNCRKLFVFVQKLIAGVATAHAEIGLKLYLECALAAENCASLNVRGKNHSSGSCDFNGMAYEFIAQAFILYEDEISDSKIQYRSIVSMVGTLLSCRSFVKEDYESLITKTTQYGAKLLRKPDQCKMIILCSHLFYRGEDDGLQPYHNPQRVLECLQRALKLADACMSSSSNCIHLFIEILDAYVYYFDKECPVITDKFISGLIALINAHIDDTRDFTDSTIEAQAHYSQILRHISRKKNDPQFSSQYAPIICG